MAPQIIYLSLFFMGLLLSAYRHGKPKKVENYNFWIDSIAAALVLALVYWGGFFDIMFKN